MTSVRQRMDPNIKETGKGQSTDTVAELGFD